MLECGAIGYVLKGADPDELKRQLKLSITVGNTLVQVLPKCRTITKISFI
jgi:DNA-binding NarL/FixJ family response regulator